MEIVRTIDLKVLEIGPQLDRMEAKLDKLLAAAPPPTPTPTPTPTPSDPLSWPYKVVGGWRLAYPFLRGALAIRFDGVTPKTFWTSAHSQAEDKYLEWSVPAMGTGDDLNSWPWLNPIDTDTSKWPLDYSKATKPGFWLPGCYSNSLAYYEGTLWAAPRVQYDGNPSPDTEVSSMAGIKKIFRGLGRQSYSGFVKGAAKLWLGCGGYSSGQGSASGPSLVEWVDGKVLIEPGPFSGTWEQRTPREPNYEPADPTDQRLALAPRLVDGKLQGRWCWDEIYAGGLLTSQGFTFWPWMGTGLIKYTTAGPVTFSAAPKAYRYVYNPLTYQLVGWREWPYGMVTGHDIGPDGKLYLLQPHAWKSDYHIADAVIRVFEPI